MIRRLLISLIALFSFAAHGQALEKPNITVAVGGKGLFYYLPLTIAERLNYFKDEGLKVDIVDFSGGTKALEALVGGSADIVSGAYEHTISMQAKGIDIQSVVVQGRYNGIVLGLPRAKAANYRSAADLKGLKIGVTAPGASTNHFVSLLLARQGLPTDSASYIGVGTGAGAIAAFQRGDIDALVNVDPVIAQLEMGGMLTPVVDTRTAKGMKDIYNGDYAAGCLYLSADFVKKHPRTTQAVVNAMVRALKWIRNATPEAILATVPPEYYGSNKALYETALKRNLEGLSPDGKNSMAAAENVYRVLKAFDPKVQSAKIDLSKTFDNTFVDKALKKYP